MSTSQRTYHSPHTPTQWWKRHLFLLRRLKRIGKGPQIFKKIYSCTIESILTGCITAWYCKCLASDCKALQRIVGTTQYITGAERHAIQDYTRRCQRKALNIVKDSSHPSHRLFSLLPQGKRYRCSKSGINRTLNSFCPQNIKLLNSSLNS